MGLHIPRHRLLIEEEIELHLSRVEVLIARLDRADGDPDLEDDNEDCCTLERIGEAASDDGYAIVPTLPLYAVDQSAGPINYQDGERARRAREMGVVPNGRGGWRLSS